MSLSAEDELATFIRQAIPSVWALEVLLLLRADDRSWSESELVTEMRASQTVVSNALGKLADREVILQDHDMRWRYAPAGPTLAKLIDALQVAYRERPVAVINIISRPTSLQSLADAFKFRGSV